MTKLKKLEELFSRYSDLPQEAIIKEEMLTHGFYWEKQLKIDEARGVLRLEGGPYSLRRTIIRLNKEPGSPYRIESNGEHLKVMDRETGDVIALAQPFPQDSAYQDRTFSDGTLYSAIVSPDAEVTLVGSGHQIHDPARVADAVAEIFVKKQRPPQEMPVCILIVAENFFEAVGKQEETEILQYVDAIRDRIGNQAPILLEMSPLSAGIEERIHRHGVKARLSNLEVWDPRLFARLRAVKDQRMDWEERVRRILDQVYVYGWNAVFPKLNIGIEMQQLSGFKTVEEALASTSEGIRFFMMHGAVPNLIHWRADVKLAPAGQQPATEFFLEVDRIWYDAWVKYGQDEPCGYLMGPGRSRYPDSGVYDIGRGAPLESDAKKSRERVQNVTRIG